MYEIMCFDKYGNSIDEFVQWDTNIVMYIDWEHNCTPIFQFGNTKSDRLLVVKGEAVNIENKNVARVSVPNILLQQAYPIIGFVYLESEVDGNEHYYVGKTEYNFNIPVRAKNKPSDYKFSENTEYISWVNLQEELRERIADLDSEADVYYNKTREYIDEIDSETNEYYNKIRDDIAELEDNSREHITELENSSREFLEELENNSREYIDELESNLGTAKNNANIAVNAKNDSVIAKENSESASVLSQSYAVGGTNTRDNEDIDNSKYYYLKTKDVSENFGGGFIPKGTIVFSELEYVEKYVGYVYQISDNFYTDDTFKCGAGVEYDAGTKVYWTSDGKWDCFINEMKDTVYAEDYDNTSEDEVVPLNADTLGGRPAREYATETFVTSKIAEAQLGGGEGGDIDLSGYATKDDVYNAFKDVKHPVESINGKTGAVQLTAGDIGAASLIDRGLYLSDINIIDNGEHLHYNSIVWLNPETVNNLALNWGYLETRTTGDTYNHLQKVTYIDGTKATRFYFNGVWTPWEWDNPPMSIGVEYRTTERWHGYAIYAKIVDFGALPVNSVKTIKVYEDASGGRIISAVGYEDSSGQSLPTDCFGSDTRYQVGINYNVNNLTLSTNFDGSIYTRALIIVKYIKY